MSKALLEDYVLATDGRSCYLLGSLSRKELYSSHDAAAVIRVAMSQLGEGGTLAISRGEYSLSETVDVPSGVTIKGYGKGSRLILDSSAESCFRVRDRESIVVKDLILERREPGRRGSSALEIANSGNITVTGVHCKKTGDHGIVVRDSAFLCSVEGCTFSGIDGSAVFLDHLEHGGRGGDFLPHRISNCTFYRCGKGIEADGSIVINILGCVFFQTRSNAIHLRNDSNSVLISGCRTFQLEADAIVVDNSHEINISSNIFCWHTGHGIVLRDVAWGTVTANNVIDNGSANPVDAQSARVDNRERKKLYVPRPNGKVPQADGIRLEGRTLGVTVNGNAIFNWAVTPPMEHGIYVGPDCEDNAITANTINYATSGVSVDAAADTKTVVENNVIALERAYRGTPGVMQVFLPELIEDFIDLE